MLTVRKPAIRLDYNYTISWFAEVIKWLSKTVFNDVVVYGCFYSEVLPYLLLKTLATRYRTGSRSKPFICAGKLCAEILMVHHAGYSIYRNLGIYVSFSQSI